MKSKLWKSAACGVAVVLAGVIAGKAVLDNMIQAEAADTFLGIENLITRVSNDYQEKQSKYTILEIVPDREAAQIGYLFDGYEPALSEWDSEQGRWISWRERLGQCANAEERRTLMEGDGNGNGGLKSALNSYKAQAGWTAGPVTAESGTYAESDGPAAGYEQIDVAESKTQGYFAANQENTGFQVTFQKTTQGSDEFVPGKYYIAQNALEIVDDSVTLESGQVAKSAVNSQTAVYTYNELGEYVYAGLLDQVTINQGTVSGSDTVSPGDSNSSDSNSTNSNSSNGNTSNEAPAYYAVTFAAVTTKEYADSNATGLYAVKDFSKVPQTAGQETTNFSCYHFVKADGYAEYTIAATSFYCKNTFSNQEWFKKYVLNMTEDEYSSFPVEVITYTAQELNAFAAQDKMPAFDFLFINSGKTADWQYSAGSTVNEGTKQGGDLTAEAARLLFDRVQAGKLPCLLDGNVAFTEGKTTKSTSVDENTALKNTNIFKLCVLLGQEDLENQMVNTTQAFESLNVDTLWKTLPDGYEDGNYVTGQTYVHTGDKSIIQDDFGKNTIYQGDGDVPLGFQKVVDEIELENLYRQADTSKQYTVLSTDISDAVVLRHIMNYQNRRNAQAKEEINVLEIEPAKTKDGQPTLTLEQVQKWAPTVKKVNVTVMTTAEFIGKIETLNDKYDLIYIGTSKDHMNTVKGVDNSPAAGSTVFNDHDMDGLIYFHTGDMRYSGIELSGMLDTDYVDNDRNKDLYYYTAVRYGGNDITEEKKDALISYLDGSYPVVVSSDFMESPATVFQDTDYQGYSVNLGVGQYRLSDLEQLGIKGNDISSIKIKAGYQLIAYQGDDFASDSIVFTSDASNLTTVNNESGNWNDKISSVKVEQVPDAMPAKAVNQDHIDNSSYMYEFVNQAITEKRTNFYVFDEIEDDSQLFSFYLNRPKIQLVDTSANGTNTDGIYYIQEENGKYTLQYRFTIANDSAASANTRYQCKFYIDVNADGKYSDQEDLGDIRLSYNGNAVSADQLYAGRQYVLIRDVPDGYKGVLPWKIGISQVDNPNIYCSMNGYTKLEGLEKESLKVLQIGRDQVLEPDPWWWGRENEQLYSLAEQINGKKTIYHNLKMKTNDQGQETYPLISEAYSSEDEKLEGYQDLLYHVLVYGGTYNGVTYPGISDDFDIDVDFMTIRRFENEYNAGNVNMADYNMLILGFSDAYGDFTLDGEAGKRPIDAIIDFINSGKSVLMAHDTTSYFNFPKSKNNSAIINRQTNEKASTNQYHNASTLNTYIRGLVGMDRYGVMDMQFLQTGKTMDSNSEFWNTLLQSGKDIAYKAKSNRTQMVSNTQGFTYTLINAKDKHSTEAGKGNISEVDYTPAETGLTDVWKNQYLNLKYDTVYYHDQNDPSGVGYQDNGEIPLNYNAETTNLQVTQVNQGQITEYPYKLSESFQVATTHGQYYQLDYTADDDKDGQSDLVVWYCLGGRVSSGGQYQETVYSSSPNDVVNNYYIYTKGNITYTGMGHAAGRNGLNVPYSLDNCTVEEAKLFINTIIAAYHAGVKAPTISVQEDGTENSPAKSVLYQYYDGDFALDSVGEAADATEKVYFTTRDVNFVKGTRKLSVKLYRDSASGTETISVSNDKVKVEQLNYTIYNAKTDKAVNPDNLESGGIYYVLVPKSVLKDCDTGLNLYFEAQSVITTSNNKTYTTDKAYAQLKVLKTYLFDLD